MQPISLMNYKGAKRYTLADLPVDTRIYYTGDMANAEGEGKITRCETGSRFGDTVDILLDDGREMRGIYPCGFDAGPGTRFHIWAEYDRKRRERYKAFTGHDLP